MQYGVFGACLQLLQPADQLREAQQREESRRLAAQQASVANTAVPDFYQASPVGSDVLPVQLSASSMVDNTRSSTVMDFPHPATAEGAAAPGSSATLLPVDEFDTWDYEEEGPGPGAVSNAATAGDDWGNQDSPMMGLFDMPAAPRHDYITTSTRRSQHGGYGDDGGDDNDYDNDFSFAPTSDGE